MKNSETYGWVGKTCRINLTTENIKIETTEKYTKRFIGGRVRDH